MNEREIREGIRAAFKVIRKMEPRHWEALQRHVASGRKSPEEIQAAIESDPDLAEASELLAEELPSRTRNSERDPDSTQ